MANGLNAPVDPADPASVIRWTARAAEAFEHIDGTLTKIEEAQAANAEFRISAEARMALGAQTFREHATAIKDVREGLEKVVRDLPDMVRRAVEAAIPKPPNPGPVRAKADGDDRMTFKWALEKVALPLLMSGIGAGITLMVARAIGALVVAPP